MATPFDLSPAPQSGTNAFGKVPGNLSLPIDTTSLNPTAGADIMSELGGTLSPGTMSALGNARATFGVQSGMPGSGLSWNSLYGNIAGASEARQRQGIQDYNAVTGPAFQTGVAEQNAVNNASPDPAQAASYAEQLFNKYLARMGGGGGGGVTGLPSSFLNPGGFAGMLGGGGGRSAVSAPVNPASGATDMSWLYGTNPASGNSWSPSGGSMDIPDYPTGDPIGDTGYNFDAPTNSTTYDDASMWG